MDSREGDTILSQDEAALLQPKPASQQGVRTVYQNPGCGQGLKRVSSLIACPPVLAEPLFPQEFRQKQKRQPRPTPKLWLV